MLRWVLCLMVAVSLPLLAASEADNFDTLLKKANSTRLSNPPQTQAILAKLAGRLDEASLAQVQAYDLLVAHQQMLRGDYGTAKHKLLSLLSDQTLDANKRMRAYLLLSQAAEIQNQVSKSFGFILQAADLYPQVTDLTIKRNYQRIVVQMYSRIGDSDKALEHARMLADLARDGTAYDHCIAERAMASVYDMQDEMQKTLAVKKRQLAWCQKADNRILIADSYEFMGRYYLQQQAPEQALSYFRQAQSNWQDMGFADGQMAIALDLARTFLALNNYPLARHWVAKAEQLISPGGHWVEMASIYKIKATLAIRDSDYNAMLTYQNKYLDAVKNTLEKTRGVKTAFLQAKLDDASQKQHIAILEKENKLLALKESNRSKSYWLVMQGLIAVLVICILLAVLAARIFYQRRKLKQLSETDALTETLPRPAFFEYARALFNENRVLRVPLSVMVVDIDRFRSFNQQYGLGTGDRAIRRIAERLQRVAHEEDLLGRTDGGEFTLIMHDCTLAQAENRMREFRRNTLDTGVQGNLDLLLSASVGLAQAYPGHTSIEDAIAAACAALDQARAEGNSVTGISPVPS